ncbi:MAG TPA: thymidine phosphorylase, partial [Gemmatimonadales bacterium]|nr:thymidine phosphorylase [Gemmatimonadales bacterium]
MVIPSLIQHKRDGHALKPAEWSELIREYTAGRVPDYQMSALLMAVVWRGMAPEELAALTDAMIESGDRLSFEGFGTPRV